MFLEKLYLNTWLQNVYGKKATVMFRTNLLHEKPNGACHRYFMLSPDVMSCNIEIYNQLNAQFFIYSIIILYHDPLQVSIITCSSSGGYCIFAASVILTLCMLPYVAPIKSGLQFYTMMHGQKYIKFY
jgi:hypothetical protein